MPDWWWRCACSVTDLTKHDVSERKHSDCIKIAENTNIILSSSGTNQRILGFVVYYVSERDVINFENIHGKPYKIWKAMFTSKSAVLCTVASDYLNNMGCVKGTGVVREFVWDGKRTEAILGIVRTNEQWNTRRRFFCYLLSYYAAAAAEAEKKPCGGASPHIPLQELWLAAGIISD